jgi:hypothetical protein
MTDKQDAKLNMYQKVTNVCDENVQVYANVPAFVETVNGLKQLVSEITAVTRQQLASSPKGATKNKSSAIDHLAETGVKIANSLYVYSIDTENNDLREKVNVNKSSFYQTHSQAALTLAKTVAAEANTFGSNLYHYGINDSDRAELDTAITQFEKLINTPVGVVGKRKMHTSNLRELFVAADSIVYDKLDKLITLFKTSSPDFYTLYGNARNIINTAARKRKEKE